MLSMFCNFIITISVEQMTVSSHLSYQQGNQVPGWLNAIICTQDCLCINLITGTKSEAYSNSLCFSQMAMFFNKCILGEKKKENKNFLHLHLGKMKTS